LKYYFTKTQAQKKKEEKQEQNKTKTNKNKAKNTTQITTKMNTRPHKKTID
jgi:hypothetical protein